VTVVDEKMAASELWELISVGLPLVVKRVSGVSDITYSSIRDFMMSHVQSMNREICEFSKRSGFEMVDFAMDIFESRVDPCKTVNERIEPESALWKHCSQDMILRLVQRPEFLASKSEFFSSSYISCSCPFADHDMECDLPGTGKMMIVQLTGVKRIQLHNVNCEECHSFGVTLRAGDICKTTYM
jgi:hypothetical protein